MKRLLSFLNPFPLMKKVYFYYKRNGLRRTMTRIANVFRFRAHFKRHVVYTKADLEAQRATIFEKNIRISVLVPLYNTPAKFLRAMIESVTAQTYSNWELCLADGSDESHAEVAKIVSEYAQGDTRIVYRKLEKNGGISENTNACIDMSTGQYIALFDHDDCLHPSALYEVMKAICEQNADFIYTDEATFLKTPRDAYGPNFKPDYSPDTLRSYNYICHLCVFSRELLDKAGRFRHEFDGSQDYDLLLRLTEQAQTIVHIPKILYYWRCHKNSVSFDISAKPYTVTAAKSALQEHLDRLGLQGEISDAIVPSTYRIRYKINASPRVSIVIPNKDYHETLDTCIRSIESKSTYQNYEIVIVENNSEKEETFAYYDKICAEYDNIRLLTYQCEGGFNYSKINNFALAQIECDYVIFLNNDIEILSPDWIEDMLGYTQRAEVGACGMMLYYPDDTVQHAGVILGLGGVAGHSHKNYRRGDFGYMSRLVIAQNLSAVTAAAMMVKKSVLDEVENFDESLAVAFNDVDLCMKIRKAGYLIVFTPFAQAYHYESKSRGLENSPEKIKRFQGEIARFHEKWGEQLKAGDPYYNPNLTLDHEDFRLK
jgi:GT2 family glycosyltransferase